MKEEFDTENFENDEEITNKERFYRVLAYIPFLNVFLLMTEKYETQESSKKYVRQGMALFLLYFVGFFIISIVSFRLSFILTVIYIAFIVFCATKAYNNMYAEIPFLNSLITQFYSGSKESGKKEDSKKKDNDIL